MIVENEKENEEENEEENEVYLVDALAKKHY